VDDEPAVSVVCCGGTSQESLDLLEENVDVIVDWPSSSPDMWMMELLWAILKNVVRKVRPEHGRH
jgi:hypothetical protein